MRVSLNYGTFVQDKNFVMSLLSKRALTDKSRSQLLSDITVLLDSVNDTDSSPEVRIGLSSWHIVSFSSILCADFVFRRLQKKI